MTSYSALNGLGQTSGGIAQTLEAQYAELRRKCIDTYGADLCNAVLPRNMVYAVTREERRSEIPWWAWMLIGGVIGRILR